MIGTLIAGHAAVFVGTWALHKVAGPLLLRRAERRAEGLLLRALRAIP